MGRGFNPEETNVSLGTEADQVISSLLIIKLTKRTGTYYFVKIFSFTEFPFLYDENEIYYHFMETI